MNTPKISVVIPAYNEDSHILHVIDAVRDNPNIIEIIVVDDHSKPKYATLYKEIKGIRLIRHEEKNKGKTEAMRTGAKAAKGDYVLYLDADLVGLTKRHFKVAIEHLDDYDIVRLARGDDFGWAKNVGLAYLVGGEVIIKKDILLDNETRLFDTVRWGFEPVLNYYIMERCPKFGIFELEGVNHILKMKKYNPVEGFIGDARFVSDVLIKQLKLVDYVKMYSFFYPYIKGKLKIASN